jgi:hypothetical protein
LIALALNRKGLPVKLAATKPRSKATGGEIRPETQINSSITKMSCCTLILAVKKVSLFSGLILEFSKLMLLNCYATKMRDKSDFNHIK